MITHKQLTLAEVFEDCQNKFDNDKYQFLIFLDEAVNLDEIVPVSFISHSHACTGRPGKHQLYPMFVFANKTSKHILKIGLLECFSISNMKKLYKLLLFII